jgi:polyketide biosynthesis enoyl-CoA hydratase PksI
MTTPITIAPLAENELIGVLSLHDEASKNTFTDEFADCFMDHLRALQKQCPYKVIILRGMPDVFCAGAAKETLMELFGGDVSVKDLQLSELIMTLPVPVIAAMEGAALGGGLVVGLCCDIMVMNERRMYGVNFTNMGFTPGMGATQLLQGLVGDFIANEMMFTGRLLKGKTFRDRSLVNHVLPQKEIWPKAVDIALDIVDKPRGTLEILKYSLTARKRHLLIDARVHEDFMHKISFAQPEVKAMIDELYNEKR